MELTKKIAIVTGASQGTGAAIARALGVEGCHVILLARTESLLNEVVAQIVKNGGQARAYVVDLSDSEAVEKVSKAILAEYGAPDILVHNAGAGAWKYVEETSCEEVRKMMDAPYFAAFYLTHFLLPAMKLKNSGTIVFLNSPASFCVWPGATGYTAARHALLGFSTALQTDLSRTRIHVCNVTSGKIESNYFINNPQSEERMPKINAIFPKMTPEYVAQEIVKCIKKDKKQAYIPFALRPLHFFNQLFPSITRWFMRF